MRPKQARNASRCPGRRLGCYVLLAQSRVRWDDDQPGRLPDTPAAQAACGKRTSFKETRPLRRNDGEEPPLAGHALELVSAAVIEFES